jgi:hypothetical protein
MMFLEARSPHGSAAPVKRNLPQKITHSATICLRWVNFGRRWWINFQYRLTPLGCCIEERQKKIPSGKPGRDLENESGGDLLYHQVTLAAPSALKNSYKLQAPSCRLHINNVTTPIRNL